MDAHTLADALRVEAEALAVAAERAPLDRDVPACPGMTVRDLVAHVGSIHRLVPRWIADGGRPAGWECSPDDDLIAWYRAGVVALLAVLDPSRAASPAATWCPWDGTLVFWVRRMAHETAVHRVDAQAATGAAAPLADGLAADGIDEVLRLWLGCHQPPGAHTSGRAVTLRVPGREWTVALHEGVVDYRASAGAAAVVSGTPSAVDLWLWGRAGEEHVSVEGDVAVVRALRAAVAAATQ
ncbi:maleylpyruvate isomerase family mycothiol-dependent enzyme [Actinosynnema sp. NPDC053489]|uniref:maleylpyruvate isomerase family mycothiol-dependent enzyme n=1 Tax=Actinosynnema sp. NPDC053489 TaxID=3363916 RepID=UPI0037CA9032